ncbi:hypothetical protein [Pseudohongiella spirulinae]|nr:hypothetical protein [Pseudohongiella spirulinae]
MNRSLAVSLLMGLSLASLDVRAEVRPERLWLPPAFAQYSDALSTAAELALEHPDCREVLYGRLNEFRSAQTEISFTILCMKDARSTFNQVFALADLLDNPAADARRAARQQELEQLRGLLQPSSRPGSDNEAETEADAEQDEDSSPEIF